MRIALAILLCAASAQASGRFAIVAGNNQGAAGRAKLWYAERDAERFARALRELGDFNQDRVVLLKSPDASEWRDALEKTMHRIALARSAGEHPLLVVYFSGHAGAAGLELGDERIPYEELRAALARSGADTKVAIVDACEAGELTQVKGLRVDPTVDFALPSDESVQGTALIASTAVGEAAQESAAIGGSFFTHHLEIALRGAGDADGDGRVTLAEAFRYTAARTVAGTATTQAGPQHPTYDFRMAGRGDVVLADLRRGEGTLRLPGDLGAQYIVHGVSEFLAEVAGTREGTTLALPAGKYTVERRSDEGLASTSFTLAHGESRVLPALQPTAYERARAKGGPAPRLAFIGGGAASFPLPGLSVSPFVRAGVRQEVGPVGLRLRLDFMRGTGLNPAGAYNLSLFGGGLAALYPVPLGPVLLEVGPEAGAGVVTQSVSGSSHSVADLTAQGVAIATFRAGPLRLGVDATAGVHRFPLDGNTALKPGASLALLVLYGL
ncbi:MAG: caspase domain-containing protein [Myxococcales bacterium]|nr:caspase family protein [Myxococcales bacterium]